MTIAERTYTGRVGSSSDLTQKPQLKDRSVVMWGGFGSEEYMEPYVIDQRSARSLKIYSAK